VEAVAVAHTIQPQQICQEAPLVFLIQVRLRLQVLLQQLVMVAVVGLLAVLVVMAYQVAVVVVIMVQQAI
jgi:hypothetical protein